MFKEIKQPNLLKEILSQIEHNVLLGTLRKGDKLPTEREWATTLGVSRTTLREAIKSLELLGLVECTQGAGNYISSDLANSFSLPLAIMFQLEKGTVKHIHQFRKALELAAVDGAVGLIGPREISELVQVCESMEQGNTAMHIPMAILDRQFHSIIAKVSGNPLIVTMMNAAESLVQIHIRDAREHMMSHTDAFQTVNRQHRVLVDALAHKDREAAMRAITDHMDFVGEFTDQSPVAG